VLRTDPTEVTTVVRAVDLQGLERPGVRVTAALPDPSWAGRWDRIHVPVQTKIRLLNFGLLCLTSERIRSTIGFPVHGLALLSGPPGTGKTTLAQGLAQRLAVELTERALADAVLLVTVDPHAFPSELLGRSQRAIATLFAETVPEIADFGHPLVVLIDEVETVAVSRTRASFETNPVDVHRSTDAVLTGLDALAARPDVLVVTTTNHVGAVDEAFLSRVDLHERFALPPLEAVTAILRDTLEQIGVPVAFDDPLLLEVSRDCVGARLDARRIRKLVLTAVISGSPEVALDPRRLSLAGLRGLVRSSVANGHAVTGQF
jgi:pachytene checkpoint protein 2